MLAASKVKMSDSEKKKANKDITNNNFGEHIRHFLYKMCNWDVLRCRRAKQRASNKCTKKRAALAKLFFLLIRTIAIFCRSRCRHRLALHDCICLFE